MRQYNESICDKNRYFTQNMLRNRYYRISRPIKIAKNKCSKCGQPLRGHTCFGPNYKVVHIKLNGHKYEEEVCNEVKMPDDIDIEIQDIIQEYGMNSKISQVNTFDELQWFGSEYL